MHSRLEKLAQILNLPFQWYGRRGGWLFLGLFAAFWLGCASPYGPGLWLDHFFNDQAKRLAAPFRQAHPDILIVDVDMETLARIPHRWPWPRSEIARILDIIAGGKPRIVLLDIVFQHLDTGDSSKGDEVFMETIRRMGNVALVSLVEERFTEEGLKLTKYTSHERFREAAKFNGFVWGVVDSDGVVRSTVFRDDRVFGESCVSQIARSLDPNCAAQSLASNSAFSGLVTFPEKGGGFPFINVLDILEGNIDPALFQNKIVLFGVSAGILHDYHTTPVGLIPGVQLLATSLDSLLQNRISTFWGGFGIRLLLAFVGGALGAIFLIRSDKTAIFYAFLTMAALTALGMVSGEVFYLQLPMGAFVLAMTFVGLVLFFASHLGNVVTIQLMQAEAEAARKIQATLFPATSWSSPQGYSCKGICIPCQEVGGDYYDFTSQSDGSLVFLIGDVSGHGFSAAMITSIAKTVTTLLNQWEQLNPQSLVLNLNTILYQLMRKRRLMTALVGHLDPQTGVVTLISAGHLPAVLIEPQGPIQEFGLPSLPLGAKEYANRPALSFTLKPGSSLVLYTDGIIEALNWKEDQFGFQPWLDSLQKRFQTDGSSKELNDILAEVRDHSRGRPFDDDVTLLLLSRAPDSGKDPVPSQKVSGNIEEPIV